MPEWSNGALSKSVELKGSGGSNPSPSAILRSAKLNFGWPLAMQRQDSNKFKYYIMNKKIVLAGGCFWGMEELFRSRPGVLNTRVGYTGGENKNPTYENHPGHAEAIEIEYDTDKTNYKELLDFFFCIHNPTTLNQQGNDIGTSYRSAIFYTNEEEKKIAEDFIDLVNNSGRWQDKVVTNLEHLEKFYEAEDYHQDYLQKNPDGYTCHFIRFNSYL